MSPCPVLRLVGYLGVYPLNDGYQLLGNLRPTKARKEVLGNVCGINYSSALNQLNGLK